MSRLHGATVKAGELHVLQSQLRAFADSLGQMQADIESLIEASDRAKCEGPG